MRRVFQPRTAVDASSTITSGVGTTPPIRPFAHRDRAAEQEVDRGEGQQGDHGRPAAADDQMADQEPESDTDTADDQPRVPVVGRAEADQGEQRRARRRRRGRRRTSAAGSHCRQRARIWVVRAPRERLPAFDGVARHAATPAAMTRRRSARPVTVRMVSPPPRWMPAVASGSTTTMTLRTSGPNCAPARCSSTNGRCGPVTTKRMLVSPARSTAPQREGGEVDRRRLDPGQDVEGQLRGTPADVVRAADDRRVLLVAHDPQHDRRADADRGLEVGDLGGAVGGDERFGVLAGPLVEDVLATGVGRAGRCRRGR